MSVNRKTNSGLQKLAGLYNALTARLSDLLDVNITTPTNGQTLLYDNTTSKWKNGSLASNSVTAMTGYSKPQSTSAITTSDTLNTAIGKLEAALSGGGGSDILILHLSEDEETGDTVCDKTPSEVLAAYQAGTVLFLLDTRYDELYLFDNYNGYDDYYYMLFSRCETAYGGLITTVTYELTSSEDEDVWDDIDYEHTELEFNHAEISLSNGSYSCSSSPTKINLSLQYRSSLGVFLKYTEDDTVYNVSYADFTNDVYHFSAVIKDASNNFKLRTFVLTASGNSWGSITMNEIPIVDSTNAIKWSEASTSVKKNWLPNNAISQTVNGVTFTVNADKSVTVNGTATADAMFNLCPAQGFENDIGRGDNKSTLYLASGSYLFTNATSTSIMSGVRLILNNVNGVAQWVDADNTTVRTITAPEHPITVGINVASGTVVSNLTLYPMIRLASVENDTYVPYIPDNVELGEKKVGWDESSRSVKKNLLNYNLNSLKAINSDGTWSENIYTHNNVTFTVNSDKTISVSGTSSSKAVLVLAYYSTWEPEPLKILSGCPSNGSLPTYSLRWIREGAYSRNDLGEGVLLDYSGTLAVYIRIEIASGVSVSNLTFKPMLRLASIEDDTYVPYIPDNVELETKKISWEDVKTSVKKNWLSLSATTQTVNGVTFTVNADGTITVNGTASAITQISINDTNRFTNLGSYILSGCPSGGGNTTFDLRTDANVDGSSDKIDTGDGIAFSKSTNSGTRIIITIRSGYVASNLVFKPMIRLASIEDNAYVPYIPDNTELVDWKSNGILGAKNIVNLNEHTPITTIAGITYTINSDGCSVSVSAGTATANSYFPNDNVLTQKYYDLKPNTRYIASFGVTLDSTTYIQAYKRLSTDADWTWVASTNSGTSLEFTTDSNANYIYWIRLCYISSKSVSATTLYPMIRLAFDSDNTFQPYAKTNRELTVDSSQSIKWDEAKTTVKKNLIPNLFSTQTIEGVTFTLNSDGSLTLNGTATAQITRAIVPGDVASKYLYPLCNHGRLIISGTGFSNSRLVYNLYLHDLTEGHKNFTVGQLDRIVDLSNYANNVDAANFSLIVYKDAVFDNETIYPMIRMASIEDSDYVKYVYDNAELKTLVDDKVNRAGDTFTGRVSFQASDNTVKVNLRPENSDYYSTIQHQTGGNEATVFATKKDVTSYIFANGEDAIGNNGNGTRWYALVPGLQIKKNKVAMGKLIASGVDPTYQLDVGGTLNVDGNVYKNGIQVDLETHLDQTATTSTTTDTVYTFTDARITSSSAIDVYADIFGVSPSNVVTTNGSCTVTFPKQATAQSMTCRIYIK